MKPPIGIEPQHLWREQRARDLIASIGRHAKVDENGTSCIGEACVLDWIDEAREHLVWIRENPPVPTVEQLAERRHRNDSPF